MNAVAVQGTMATMDAFEVLHLSPGQYTEDEIKSAYRARAMEVHPDKGGSRTDWDAVEQAYRYLLEAAPTWTGGPVPAQASQRLWLAWLSVAHSRRVVFTSSVWLLAGVPASWWIWKEGTEFGWPWQFPASLIGYGAGWWIWYVGRELAAVARVRESWARWRVRRK